MDYLRSIALKEQSTVAETPPGVAPSDKVWDKLPNYEPNWRRLRRNRIVVGQLSEPAGVAFELLAAKVMRESRHKGWTTVAVTSPTVGCGKSVLSLNLALALSRIGHGRTVLLDLDLRRPRMARLLGNKPLAFHEFLRGSRPAAETFLRWGDTLAIGAPADRLPQSDGVLSAETMTRAVARVREVFSPAIVLIDLPPVFGNSDVHAFLGTIDCSLIVAAAGASRMAELDACEREIAAQTNVLGIVLNKCRFMPFGGGY